MYLNVTLCIVTDGCELTMDYDMIVILVKVDFKLVDMLS